MQEAIRREVADLAAVGPYGHGAFDGDELAAVSTWEARGSAWLSSIIAVQREHRRRGLATQLKRELLMLARRSGASEVHSVIAWGNDAMLVVNRRLGAEIVPVSRPFGRVEYLRAIIKVNG